MSRCSPGWRRTTPRPPPPSCGASRLAFTAWRWRSSARRRSPRRWHKRPSSGLGVTPPRSTRARGHVASWLLTITRNRAIDAVRLRGERPVDPHLLLVSLVSREEVETPGTTYEESERLRTALRALPPEQSKAIVLSVFYGLT